MSLLNRIVEAKTARQEARTEAEIQLRTARLEAAQRAHEEKTQLARNQHVAEMVNRPFLTAVGRWTTPQALERQPADVRAQLERIGEDVRALMRAAGSPAITKGERAWNDALPGMMEQLLQCAEIAKVKSPALAFEITTVLLGAKPTSRTSWRQRALAAENAGDLPSAIHAHQSYLNLTFGDRLGVMDRLRRLTERDDRRVQLIGVVGAARRAGALPKGTGHVLGLLEGHTPHRQLDNAVAELVTSVRTLDVSELAAPVLQDVLFHAGRWHRSVTLQPPVLDEDVARGMTVLRLNDLRQRLGGTRVGLVSDDATRLRGNALGTRVDEYDVVVRVGGSRVGPADGGSRTDLQVLRHDAVEGWDEEAWMRLVLADEPEDWVRAVRGRLIPGRQHAIAEKALRRPAGAEDGEAGGSPAYQLLRLLDLLAVCETVDLIGFHPEEDFSIEELAWLTPRLDRLDEHAIGVR